MLVREGCSLVAVGFELLDQVVDAVTHLTEFVRRLGHVIDGGRFLLDAG